ncbi:hypothetical protein L226DRAFT_264845 [Lentinus tigrinus ALCF2SS1-7]|uniref:uncharacterized protein n=1 Tax=Lentinus tigrinus ALCF2SS1-7 TaxID=1328758 RepID=UPI001165FF81|nr:hypothetical protein L226DRAFT_264845 [Lentinus tigrinus ALCF2SS1-7]
MPQPQRRSSRRTATCTSYYSPIPPPLPPKPVIMPRYRHPNTGRSRVSPVAPSFSTSSSTATSSGGRSRKSPAAPSFSSAPARLPYPYPSNRRGSLDDFVLRPRPRAASHSQTMRSHNTAPHRTKARRVAPRDSRPLGHRLRRAIVGAWKRVTATLRGPISNAGHTPAGFVIVQSAPSTADLRMGGW